MVRVFRVVLEMSITGAWVILTVLLARLLLRPFPKRCSYVLWAVVGFRLCCPVSFSSFFSLFRLPSVQTGAVVTQTRMPIPQTVVMGTNQSGAPPVAISTGIPAGPDWMEVMTALWLAGMAAMLLCGIVCHIRLRLRLRTAIRLRDNIYESEQVASPFILGVFHPRIYLPFGLDARQSDYVLAHERCHLKRLDHIVKLLAWLILAVHWFNPLCYVAFRLMGRDMEMSCDEAVLRKSADRHDYSAALVSIAAERKMPVPSPLAFGETAVKGRVKNILRWKKPKVWAALVAVVLCGAVILVCVADPVETFRLEEGKYIIANGETGEDYSIGAMVEIRDDKLYTTDAIHDLSGKEWEAAPFDPLQWERMLQHLEGAAPETLEDCQYIELFTVTDETLDEYMQTVYYSPLETIPPYGTMGGYVRQIFLLRQGGTLFVCDYLLGPEGEDTSFPPMERLVSNRLAEPGSELDPTVQTFAQLDGLMEQVLALPGKTVQEKADGDEALYWKILRHRHIMYYLCHVMQTEGLNGEKGELAGILFEDVLMRRFEEPLIQRGNMTAAQYFESYMAYAREYYSGEKAYPSNNASGPMLYYLQTYYDYGK